MATVPSNTNQAGKHSTSTRSSTESRALELLGAGQSAETTANACGVSVSRISQLLSEPEFAAAVSELRFGALQKHNVRDAGYDSVEDELLTRFKSSMPMLFKPMEILKAMQVVNSMKRRGQSAPESITQQQAIVTIVMPAVLVEKFTVNAQNQVISAGKQELLTVQSGQVAGMAEKLGSAKLAQRVAESIEVGSIKESTIFGSTS